MLRIYPQDDFEYVNLETTPQDLYIKLDILVRPVPIIPIKRLYSHEFDITKKQRVFWANIASVNNLPDPLIPLLETMDFYILTATIGETPYLPKLYKEAKLRNDYNKYQYEPIRD